jgi:hypothetical protein
VTTFLAQVHQVWAALTALIPGLSGVTWGVLFGGSALFGATRVIRHMRRRRISIGDATIGRLERTDESGASLFRSARAVAEKPSLSPFWGRPVWLRASPYPGAVAIAWTWIHHRWVVISIASALVTRLVIWCWDRLQLRGHMRGIVLPMVTALENALQAPAADIIDGIAIPRHWQEPAAELIVPLPDHHRPAHVGEAARIVHERLGGDWNHVRTSAAPYFLHFSHKPSPPTLISFEDVADLLAHPAGLWEPFIGLGCEHEQMRLNFNGHVVHLGVSAGTGAGKSTLLRLLAIQFAIASGGTAQQTYLDVKGDDEGMAYVPGMRVLNDIGDVDSLTGIYPMWKVVREYVVELDARRRGLRGPKEAWEPMILYNDEQNAFAKFSKQAWDLVKEKGDPATPPVWQDMYLLAVMGRSFKIRLINAYQIMSAAATGGGNAQDGGEMRRQFGNKMLARFDPAAWDALVGTRPRGQSSDVPGRWLWVNNAGVARDVQLPKFEPEHVVELAQYAGLGAPATQSPRPVPAGGRAFPHHLPGRAGDTGTGDTPSSGERVVLPFRPRGAASSPPPSFGGKTPTPNEGDAAVLQPERYTLREACEQSIIRMSYEAAKRARTRATDRADLYPVFPQGFREGASTKYTADELRAWEAAYEENRQAR